MPKRTRATSATRELTYLLLAERAVPYLLARVRWPDVAQAISAASPDWIDDPGLFDLPYDPSAVTVTIPQAASVAAGWDARLEDEPAASGASYIRRMPSNWSDLTPSERRTWGLEFVGRRRTRRHRAPGRRSLQKKLAADANSHLVALPGPVADDRVQLAALTNTPPLVTVERRGAARVRLGGHAYIRCDHTTISAGLVDLSEQGVRCVLPDGLPLIGAGATLGGAFLLEAEGHKSRICLDVPGRISWRRSAASGTHLGVAFDELGGGQLEGVRRFLAAAGRKRGRR
jgi:PilZ domain